jgi:predicted nucleic acid-binding protein
MTESFIVVYDACVLYPMILRDLLLRLAATELFMAKWTNQIHDEWIRNLLRSRPDLTREKLERVRMLMDQNTLDCIVNNYEDLIPELDLPDPDDRHVLAAAIQAKASMIVTFNLKDFPAASLDQYQIEACHPDDFIQLLAEIDLNKVLAAVKIACTSLKRPPVSESEYLGILAKHGLAKAAALFGIHN